MTVSQSIILWLKTFDSTTRPLDTIDTDIQSAVDSTYSLIKTPVQNIKSYLSGRKEITDRYTLMARLDSQNNTARIDNGTWGEELSYWIKIQNMNQNYPILNGATVQEISISTPFYLGKSETNSSLYELTIAIKYVKET